MKHERTGWRDIELSLRHRLWGEDAPMVDVDWFVVEYDRSEPVAFIDYKLTGYEHDHSHPSIVAFTKAATSAGLPAFMVEYSKSPWWFRPEPLNNAARQLMAPGAFGVMSEKEWVHFIYWLRCREVPQRVWDEIDEANAKRRPIVAVEEDEQ